MTTSSPDPADEIRRVLHDAAAQLQELGVDSGLAAPLLEALQRSDAPLTLQHDLDAAGRLLTETARRVDEVERVEADRQPLGPTWFAVHRRDLKRRAASDRAAHLAAMWLSALDGKKLALCDRIADLAAIADVDGARAPMLAVTDAVAVDDPAGALPALAELARTLPTIAVPLVALQARIHLRATGDVTAALQAATRAVATAGEGGDDTARAVAAAVLAEVQLVGGDPDRAGETIAAALALPVSEPDVHLVAGLLEQHRSNWPQMDDQYTEAARGFVDRGAHVGLLRSEPPNLLWRMARQLSAADPTRALAHLETAVATGIVGKGAFPERKALCDKARIEERLGQTAVAARTYGAAADRYLWSNSRNRALSLYQQAHELAPDDVELAWGYAEGLRSQVEDDDTVVDRGRAELARRLIRAGTARRRPDPSHAWVLATDAVLGLALGDANDDVTFLLESALMLDGDRGLVHTWLITALRQGGHVRDAVAAALAAQPLAPHDPVLVDATAAALADAGDFAAALQVIADHPEPDDTLTVRTAVVQLQRDDPGAALGVLDGVPPSDLTSLVRGLAHEMLGQSDRAAEEFETLWKNLPASGDGDVTGVRRMAAMAAYHTNRYDDAVRILDDLAERRPRDTGYGLDLGLVLVASGDVDRGGPQLIDAVDTCTSVEELLFLHRFDLSQARARVRGLPHERAAVAALDTAAVHCAERIAVLRAGVRPASRWAVRAARARLALADGRLDEAVERYQELLDTAPEARHGLTRAVDTLIERGDELLRTGRVEEARTEWTTALRGAAAAGGERATALRARIAVSHLTGDDDLPAATLSAALQGPEVVAAWRPVLQLCVHDVPSAWRLRDRLLAHRDDLEHAQHRRLLLDIASAVPFGAVYRLDRDAVPAAAVFPMFTPVEVRLPHRHRALAGSREVRGAINALRRQLAADTGIRVPGIRVVPADDPEVDELSIAVYGLVVHRRTPPRGERFDAGDLAVALGATLRTHMHRMIGTDDVELWLAGWDDPAATPWDGPHIDAAGRLRVTRVLRRLLREGVPVTDRAAIMTCFLAAEAAGEDTAGALRAVRRGLAPDVLSGGAQRSRLPLPAEVVARVRAGLDGPAWRGPRAEATALQDDLRRWRATLPDDVAVTVDDPALRSVVWRLLAAAGAPTPVLSAEEETR